MDKTQKIRCPFCSNQLTAEKMKKHILEKHGLHYTKWHESLSDAESAPICNWEKIQE